MSKNLKAVILYTVLTVIFTWPLVPHITTHYPSTFYGEGGDPNMYVWFMDSVAKKVADPNFHPSQMIFYPKGMNFMAGYEGPIMLVLGVPIILLTHNPILAYNLILLVAFILTCYTCYLLILYLTNSYFSAFITGFSFGLSPYMIVRGVQHIDLLLLFTVPLVVLFGFKFVAEPTNKRSLLLALAMLLTALSAWYYLVGSLMFLGLLFLFNFRKFLANKKSYFIAAGVTAFAVALAAAPMYLNRSTSSFKYVDFLIETRGASVLNFFIPHPYMQSWSSVVYNFFVSPYEATSYFGLVGLIAIFTLVLLRKKINIPYRNLWITTILVFIIVAMGNHIDLFGRRIPMPFEFLRHFIPFNRLRAPNRFFVFSYLATTVIFGYFLAYIRNYFSKPRFLWGFSALLIILLLSERVILPYPVMAIEVPEFYKTLGTNSENFAIADLPFINPGISLYNYYQLYHKKPIVDGEYFWTAYDGQTFDFAKSNGLLLNSVPCNEKSVPKVDRAVALKQLSDNNIRYIVVHNLILQGLYCPLLTKFMHDFFAGQKPIFTDGEISVYSTGQ